MCVCVYLKITQNITLFTVDANKVLIMYCMPNEIQTTRYGPLSTVRLYCP